MIRFSPAFVHALSFSLEETGADQTNPPKLVLEGGLYSTFPPPPKSHDTFCPSPSSSLPSFFRSPDSSLPPEVVFRSWHAVEYASAQLRGDHNFMLKAASQEHASALKSNTGSGPPDQKKIRKNKSNWNQRFSNMTSVK